MISRRDFLFAGTGTLLTGCDVSDGRTPIGYAGVLTDRNQTRGLIARGVRRRGSGRPVTAVDHWHIGSNAKAMTSALYARLVEQGAVSWDSTVEQLFDGIAVHESWRKVPIIQFMAHVAGLSDGGLLDSWALIKSELDERPVPRQRLNLVEKALAAPRRHSARFEYANANYVLIGAAIERRTGSAWEDVIRSQLFGPLGMDSAGFGAPAGDQPYGHKRSLLPWRGLQPLEPGSADDNPAFMRPAGGVHLGLQDYAKFLRMFLRREPSILDPQSLKVLTTPLSAVPPYALGWFIQDIPWAGGTSLVHDGSNTMWYATALVSPSRGIAAAAVANEGTERAAQVTRSLVRQLFQWTA